MVKVKVSKEVAEFIELNNNGDVYWEDRLIYEHSQAWRNNFEGSNEEALCMKNISPLELAQILVNDYEVEKTPEERLIEYFNVLGRTLEEIEKAEMEGDLIPGLSSEQVAVINTLNILDVKIKGVNDN